MRSPRRRPTTGRRSATATSLADKLAGRGVRARRGSTAYERVKDVLPAMIARLRAPVPRRFAGANGYWDFDVPVLPGRLRHRRRRHRLRAHGARPRRGRLQHLRQAQGDVFAACGTPEVPHTVGAGFVRICPACRSSPASASTTTRARTRGANEAVIAKLVEAGALLARGRLKHQYPHSWRSKAPLIFRNTPQWFIAMDKPLARQGRHAAPARALPRSRRCEWVPRRPARTASPA